VSVLLDAALELAERHRLPVFPVDLTTDGDKKPLVKWKAGATTDPAVIRGWWQRWPDAGIGYETGAVAEIVVLDVDGDAGADSLRELERAHGELPKTATVKTPRGGTHYLFRAPGEPIPNSQGKIAPGSTCAARAASPSRRRRGGRTAAPTSGTTRSGSSSRRSPPDGGRDSPSTHAAAATAP
jgi:hypothetical protein